MQFTPEMLQIYLVGGSQDVNHDPRLFLTKVEEALQAGITAFQYREKGSSKLSPTEKQQVAQQLRQLTHQYDVPLFIDDDEQLALAVGADGIHVGQKDQRIGKVIARAQGKLIIGYSCNTSAEIKKANDLVDVDYVGTGPVFPTNSKADADPALGLEELSRLTHLSSHPVVAIGGINERNMAATRQTGVAGLSVISMILKSPHISQTIRAMRALY